MPSIIPEPLVATHSGGLTDERACARTSSYGLPCLVLVNFPFKEGGGMVASAAGKKPWLEILLMPRSYLVGTLGFQSQNERVMIRVIGLHFPDDVI